MLVKRDWALRILFWKITNVTIGLIDTPEQMCYCKFFRAAIFQVTLSERL